LSVSRIHKTASPFNADELGEIDFAQAFDVMYLAHLNHGPTKLVRSGHTSWAFSTLTFGPTIAAPTGLSVSVTNPNQDADNSGNAYFPQPDNYVVTAIDDQSGQESRASSPASGVNDLTLKRNKNTLSWAAVAGAERYRVYKAHNQQEYGWIGDTEATSFVDDNITADISDAPPEAFNPFTLSGNPSTVAFFEQRLFWARTANVPNGVYSSRSADFENMDASRPTRADDSIVFRIAAQKVNSVNSLVPLNTLLALTSDAIFVIQGSNEDYLSANPPPRALRQSGRGVSRLKPQVIDDVVFYRPAVGSSVNSLGFTFEADGYRSSDISIFSPGLFIDHEIVRWAYSQEPQSILWTVRDDGKLLAFTWQQEQQVWGWTLCETAGFVEDVVAVAEQGENRVYLIVRRTIDGVERRFVERIASPKWDDQKLGCYLDCAKTWFPVEPRSTYLIPHLAGETVAALADGFVVTDLVVDEDGFVDIGFEAEEVVTIGLPYEALVETLPLMLPTREGSPANKRQLLASATIQVVDTRIAGLEVGTAMDRLYPLKGREREPLGTPPELFTGKRTIENAPVVSGEATLFIRHADPTPFTLTAAYLEPIISESD
jgi:hypothetical protein